MVPDDEKRTITDPRPVTLSKATKIFAVLNESKITVITDS
jgi:hypothetical protein